jgi:hypothetical protein
VTDYKANSRVILPRAQSDVKEGKLQVLRMELMEEGKKWIKTNCDCNGNQQSNLDKEELIGLKSLKKKIKEGLIVVLPTNKSGRFCVMSMDTYIKCGEVHTSMDEEIGLKELKANQTKLNGTLSMLIKVFGIGKDWKHENRWRESMMNESLSVCPLW